MRFLAVAFLVLIPLLSMAADKMNVLSAVNAKRAGSDFLVEMTFTNEISEKDVNIDFVKNTIEVQVPQAISIQGKSFTKIKDTVVDHIYTNQNAVDSLRCRVILGRTYSAKDFAAS